MICALFLAFLLTIPLTAGAVHPDEQLADPALEARARALSKDLRCLVCQNASIDGSDAPIARDLRRLVRERLAAGDDEGEIVQFLRGRYGDFILMRPAWNPTTWILWLGPLLALGIGAGVAWQAMRQGRLASGVETDALRPEEEARLQALMEELPPDAFDEPRGEAAEA